MSETQDASLAADIEAAVREVDAVSTIYRAGSAFSQAVAAGGRLLRIHDNDAPLVAIERGDDGISIRMALGVSATDPATETLRRCHAAVSAVLAGRGYSDPQIHLTVVHIDDPSADA